MLRKIIVIDEKKCNGCGICVGACQEGAIGIVEGKAVLLRDDYCDGLGNCLPVCPTGAISFEEREALPFDEIAVKKAMQGTQAYNVCPSTKQAVFQAEHVEIGSEEASCLQQWPVQIKLVAPNASFLKNAHLLIAADCSAFAYANFHKKFMQGNITLIGCPKLDDIDYSEKLAEILNLNEIQSITVVRMEVPCCGGIERAAMRALQLSKKEIPFTVVTITTDGKILEI